MAAHGSFTIRNREPGAGQRGGARGRGGRGGGKCVGPGAPGRGGSAIAPGRGGSAIARGRGGSAIARGRGGSAIARGRGGSAIAPGRGGSAIAPGRGGVRGPGGRGSGNQIQGDRRAGPESQGRRKMNRWRPQQKVFQGSAKEGQGFALWRKQKTQFEYKKLLRKQRKINPTQDSKFTDHYPEHLKHLYLAEEEMLRKQEKRRTPDVDALQDEEGDPQELPRKKFKKKTSNQKAKEEYERVQMERAKKREEAENNRREKEQALQLYKQKKTEAFKILNAKTKKGQPNFNVQMDYLLQKIQQNS